MKVQKLVKVTPAFQSRWDVFRAALDAAAAPFQERGRGVALPVAYANDLIGADREIERAMSGIEARPIHAVFVPHSDGLMRVEVAY